MIMIIMVLPLKKTATFGNLISPCILLYMTYPVFKVKINNPREETNKNDINLDVYDGGLLRKL